MFKLLFSSWFISKGAQGSRKGLISEGKFDFHVNYQFVNSRRLHTIGRIHATFRDPFMSFWLFSILSTITRDSLGSIRCPFCSNTVILLDFRYFADFKWSLFISKHYLRILEGKNRPLCYISCYFLNCDSFNGMPQGSRKWIIWEENFIFV